MKSSNLFAVAGIIVGAAVGAITMAAQPAKVIEIEKPVIQVVEKPVIQIVEKRSYGVKLNEFQDIDVPVFTYEDRWMEEYSVKFAYKFDKTVYLCDKKYSYILDKTSDTSTDYGSKVLKENQDLVKLCIDETLQNEEPVDEDDRTGGRDMSQNPNNFSPKE